MAGYNWTVDLDEEAQFVVQRIEGEIEEAEFKALIKETERCVARLRNPGDLRFLVDGRGLGKADARIRRLAFKTFRERGVNRMALWGCAPFIRIILRIMSVAVGNGRIRTFAQEEEARTWLAG